MSWAIINAYMIIVTNESAMRQFGERLGTMLVGGEVIELVGDVGAGKTTFVRGLAAGMGISEAIQSPSFTVNRLYDAPNGLRLTHYDFYRLDEAGIMADELGEAVNDKSTVVVIEWADAVADVLPAERLTIAIQSTGESERMLLLSAHGQSSARLVEQL